MCSSNRSLGFLLSLFLRHRWKGVIIGDLQLWQWSCQIPATPLLCCGCECCQDPWVMLWVGPFILFKSFLKPNHKINTSIWVNPLVIASNLLICNIYVFKIPEETLPSPTVDSRWTWKTQVLNINLVWGNSILEGCYWTECIGSKGSRSSFVLYKTVISWVGVWAKSSTCIRGSGQGFFFFFLAFPLDFSTAHLEVISEPQRLVSLVEAVLTGRDKLWSWGSSRSLHVSLRPLLTSRMPLLLFPSIIFLSFKHRRICNFSWRDGSVYYNDERWTSKARTFCPFFHLLIRLPALSIYFPIRQWLVGWVWKIKPMFVCVRVCVCLRRRSSAWLEQSNTCIKVKMDNCDCVFA